MLKTEEAFIAQGSLPRIFVVLGEEE